MKKYKIDNYIVTANSLHDAVSVIRRIKNTSDDFDKDYARESQALESDVKKANEDYNRLGNKSASDLFKMMGYKENGHKYYKTNGSYTRVIEFNDFDDVKYYVLKDGAIPRGWTLTRTKWHDSVKDGKYVSELKPGDVITKKDGSKWDVVLVRHTPFGIQVRMNSKTSPVKTEEITYRPTDMFVYDSVKDARRINYDDDIIEVTLNGKVVFKGYAEDWLDNNFDSNFKWTGSQYEASNAKGKWVVRVIDSFQKDSLTVRDVIQSLINEETSAISSYNVALETLKNHIPDEAYEAIKAIRDDEQRHVENLYAVLNGNVTPKNLEN